MINNFIFSNRWLSSKSCHVCCMCIVTSKSLYDYSYFLTLQIQKQASYRVNDVLRGTDWQSQNLNSSLSDFLSLDQIVNYRVLSLEGNLEAT